MRTKCAASAATITLAAVVGVSQAAVTTVGTQADFSALGSISQNTNFGFDGGCSAAFDSLVVGDLSFVPTTRLAVCNNASRALIFDEHNGATTIEIAGTHELFAVNTGTLQAAGTATFDITTNLGTYQFSPLVSGPGGVTFVGFQASAGEHFVSVVFSGSTVPGVTDVQLGSVVPEPGTYALMMGGIGLLGLVARRRT